MDCIQKIRRDNLGKLLAGRFDGNMANLSRAAKKAAPLFSDIMSTPPRKGFGERLARSIEENLDLPVGWLDSSEPLVSDPGLSPSEDLFLLSVRSELKQKDVPAHVMQTILYLLSVTPPKTKATASR